MSTSETPEAGTLTIEPLPLETAVDLTRHRSLIPAAASFPALGIVIAELSKTAATPGAPGIYRVTFPAGANGLLAEAKDGSGFLGSIVGGDKLAQARLIPVTVNPTMLAISLALAVVTQQLDRIAETQQEILAFLEQDKESTTVGHLHVLGELTRNLTHQRQSVEYRTAALTQAQTAKGYAAGNIDFYRTRVKDVMQGRKRFQTGRDVAATTAQLEPEFVQYRAALRLYAHATMLEVVLVSNRDHDYLDGMRQALEERAHHYLNLYTSCSVALEQGKAGAIEARAAGGMAMATGATGRAIGRMPFISRGQVDEALIAAETKIGKATGAATGRTVQRFAAQKEPGIGPFLEAIGAMDRVYNEPMTLLAGVDGVFVEPTTDS